MRGEEDWPRGLVFTRLVKTCIACPAQWSAWSGDQYYYIRYRSHSLTLGTFEGECRWLIPTDEHESGWMEEADMLRYLQASLAPGTVSRETEG